MKSDDLIRFTESLGAPVTALGTEGFERLLADFLGRMVAHDMMTIARYSSVGPPEFLAHSANYPPELVQRYRDLYHLFDPYDEYWKRTRTPGPVFLSDLSSGRRKAGRYIREFLPECGIADEMGIFLPPVAGSSLAVFFENAGRRFARPIRARLASLYPLAADLYRAHLTVLFNTPQDGPKSSPSADHPMLITDATGQALWSTKSWADLSDTARSKAETLARQGAGDGLEVRPLTEGHALISEAIPTGGATSKLLWAVQNSTGSEAPVDPVATGMRRFDGVLTPREREIVELILKGYPTSLIAEQLRVSRGTVKNHRRRIYEKLDITSERELFLMLIDAVLGITQT